LNLTYFLERNDPEEEFVYDLYAIQVHSGSLKGGHYIAYARHDSESTGGQEWYYYSDSNFHRVEVQEVLKQQAYMLFYKRRYL